MGINGEKILFWNTRRAKCSELMRQLMDINEEKFLFLEHEFYPLFLCPHGENAGKQVAFTHKGDDLTKI